MDKERGQIRRVGELFEKYQRTLIAPERTVVDAFIEIVDEILNIEVASDSVRYSPTTKTLSVSTTGLVKNEIRLHKEELLAHLRGRLGERNAPSVIL